MVNSINPVIFNSFPNPVSEQSVKTLPKQKNIPIEPQKSMSPVPFIFGGAVIAAALVFAFRGKFNTKVNKISNELSKTNNVNLPGNEFHINIAKMLNCSPENLKSIVGAVEFREILKKLKPENFQVGKDFCANFHIHTVKSDGLIEVKTVLEQAVELANKSGKTFIFSITDHDGIEGTQEVIRLIAKNPEKYKNIKFVPGLELNSQYFNEQSLNNPIQLELLNYCFNPFDDKVIKFMSKIKEKNKECVFNVLKAINDLEPSLNLKLENIPQNLSHLRYFGSPGLMNNLNKFINNALAEKKLTGKYNETFVKNLIKTHSTNNNSITPSTPSLKEAVEFFKSSGGVTSIAHPAKINLAGTKLSGEKTMATLINDYKSYGGEAIEYFYQVYDKDEWWQRIAKACKEELISLLKTGSYDCHNNRIDAH